MKIKKSLLSPFMVWMKKRGHKLGGSYETINMRKDGKSALIHVDDSEYCNANEYAIQRYKAFLWAYLDGGESFIRKLRNLANIEIHHKRRDHMLCNICS